MTSLPLTHYTQAAFDPIASRTSATSRGVLTTVTAQKSTFNVGFPSAYAW